MNQQEYKVGQYVEGIKKYTEDYQEVVQGKVFDVINALSGTCLIVETEEGKNRLLNAREVMYVTEAIINQNEDVKLLDKSFGQPDKVGQRAAEERYSFTEDDRPDEFKNVINTEALENVSPENKKKALELLERAASLIR
ncbi:hypothetical protein [Macrococcus bovicus]|uniref:hypothetical protein n=1 Tax=Macrococcus bovicus TaxID=69968 RepID=UPI0025A66EC0|nr:hypothetical protein [Macrococcus bovicus]WJP97087.1 hypothetical protein QSV55_07320 [Macrococcus bovicus]